MTTLVLTVPLTVISFLGLILNGYVLVVVILTKQTNSANNILLLHLGCVHLLLGVLYIAFSASNFTKHNWLEGGSLCIIHGFLFTLLHPLALWTICGLNCDRFYAIASPLHYGHIVNSRKVLFGLGASWILSLAVCIPPFFEVAPYQYIKELGTCMPHFSQGVGALWYSTFYTTLTLLLPATLITCCNLKILTIARYHRHRIASAIYEVTLSAQVTITHQRNPFFIPTLTAPASGGPKIRSHSAIVTVLQLLVSFAILYLPYYIVILWNASNGILEVSPGSIRNNPRLMTFASSLLTCSPFVNGFLYGVRNKVLRKTFQNYWRKKITKNELNQEIQARTPSNCGSRRPSISPLGLLSKQPLQRRLSDAVIEVQRFKNPCYKSSMKRISSELAWKEKSPCKEGSQNIDGKKRPRLTHTTSCNTLKVPCLKGEEEEDIFVKQMKTEELVSNLLNKPSFSSTNLLLHKVFGLESPDVSSKKFSFLQPTKDGVPKRSPKITITRAYSEDSDNALSNPNSPAKEAANKRYASSGTLLERKWNQLKCKSKENSINVEMKTSTVKPLLSSMDEGSMSNRSSDSSIVSYCSLGKLSEMTERSSCTCDKCVDVEDEYSEDQALLHRPVVGCLHNNSNQINRGLSRTKSQEIVL